MQFDLALVIDDEPQIRRVVRNALEGEVARVLEASTGTEGLEIAAAQLPALIILDLGLPDIGGIDVCREIRKSSAAPIIVLSARHSDQEKVKLLDVGADDYVTKPFSTIEFQARARAQLRRVRQAPIASLDAPLETDGLVIDFAKPALQRDGLPVHLTRTEWELLRTLAKNRGRTLTHRQLFTAVWAKSYGDAQQNLRVHIRSLRRKLESDPVRPRLIVTEPGVGYRFESEL
ncbi:MAG: response regulator transcription factor [Gemmatimonadota bacterium]|nr:response regulator transcription factor [Gemmatimonadota bacterium]